ncbi:MAG: YARHG domain-containing protein [Blautia sp.]
MFCKYCGRQLKEGEVCTCRQPKEKPVPKKNEPKKMKKQQKPERPGRPEVKRPTENPGEGKGLLILSFLCSILLFTSFLLLRIVFEETLSQSVLEGFYPYLIYIVPLIFGVLAFLFGVFSLPNRKIRTLSIAAVLISVIFTAGIFVSLFLFPYEPYANESFEDEEEDEEDLDEDENGDNEDGSTDEEDPDEEKKESVFVGIKEDYEKGKLNYAEAKNALEELNLSELQDGEEEEVFDFQSQIEEDLEDEMEKLADASDYQTILKELADMEKEIQTEDELLEELHEKYEPEYILYLDTESKKLLTEGKKDEAVKILEEGEKLVEDKEAIAAMLEDAENGVGTGDYIIPDSNSKYLKESDLNGMTIQQINYAKNEIYARHGRKFKSNELQTYFNSKSWYRGTIEPSAFNENTLNDYEKKNAELLSKKEFSMESGGYKLDQ